MNVQTKAGHFESGLLNYQVLFKRNDTMKIVGDKRIGFFVRNNCKWVRFSTIRLIQFKLQEKWFDFH